MEVEEKELVAESGDNLVEREDGESGYEDSVSEGVETLSEVVETLTDVAEQYTLDTGFSETGSPARPSLPSSDTLESLDAEKDIEILADDLLLVSLQDTLDGRFSFGENPM